MKVRTKRIYEPADEGDGLRVLVDRLWPRGLSREKARIDHWLREVAPSDALRRWFGHDPERWSGFRTRYFEELAGKHDEVAQLRRWARTQSVTLLYSARDERHNQAVVLAAYLAKRAEAPG